MKIKQKILSLILAATMASAVFTPEISGMMGASYSTADAAASTSISIPTASLKSGTYAVSGSSLKITLSGTEKNAQIYYSLNGAKYKLYSASNPVYITKDSTLKTYARTSSGYSYARIYTYKITPKVVITPGSGTYSTAQTVKVTTPTPNAFLYYTTDGKTPTTSSPRIYSDTQIKITKNTTLKVLAKKANWTSWTYTRTYKITTPSAPAAPTTSNADLLDDYTKKWAYNTLTSNQKEAYAALFDGMIKCTPSINLTSIDLRVSEYDNVFRALDYDNPQLITTTGRGSYSYFGTKMGSMYYKYDYTAAQYASKMKTIGSNTASVIAQAKALKTDYDKVKLFHDWIINRTEYINNGQEYTWRIDGPIIYKKSVCEGYSRAFQYLCQSVGIECVCVSGTAGGPHMWNMVKVNGKWYQIDVTWDDPISWDGRPVLRYDYFLISDAQMYKDHRIDSDLFTIPKATSSYAA